MEGQASVRLNGFMAIVSRAFEELQQLGPFCVLYFSSDVADSSKVKETFSAGGLRCDFHLMAGLTQKTAVICKESSFY